MDVNMASRVHISFKLFYFGSNVGEELDAWRWNRFIPWLVSRLPPIAQKIQRKWQSQLFLRTCLYSSLGGEVGLVWGILILWRQNFPIPIGLCNILLISLSLADNWQSIFHISLFIFCWQRLTPFRFLWKPCDPKNPPPLPPGDKKGLFPQQGTMNPHVTYIH